ncbi:hypothetical protein GQ600_18468 [Phytophthora cactorum]|nr:hypothetical protein GQ600_18468 [Phytophthora cactorum]
MLGNALLVTPVVFKGATTVKGYFPREIWYNIFDYSQILTSGAYLTIGVTIFDMLCIFAVEQSWRCINQLLRLQVLASHLSISSSCCHLKETLAGTCTWTMARQQQPQRHHPQFHSVGRYIQVNSFAK